MLLSRRCFSIPMEFSPRTNPINIPHRGSKQELHYTFIGFDITRTQLHLSRIIRPQIEIIFESLLSFVYYFLKTSVIPKRKKKKRSFYINVYKKDIPPFDLDDDFSIYFSRSLHRATLRNVYLMLYRVKVINLKKSWKSINKFL